MSQKSQPIPRSLAEAGFDAEIRKLRRILFVVLAGLEKSGKTDWSLRAAPGPIAFFDVDKRADQIIAKIKEEQPDKRIYPIRLHVPEEQKEAIQEYKRFERAWFAAFEDKAMSGGTVVADTWSEIWELGRMAEFGKLLQVKAHHYAPLNARFNRLLDAVRESDKNVVLLHKLTEVWRNEHPTGEYRRQGHKNSAFKADLTAEIRYDDEIRDFVLKVERCGLDPDMNGVELKGPLCSFAFLATKAHPGTSMDDWGG